MMFVTALFPIILDTKPPILYTNSVVSVSLPLLIIFYNAAIVFSFPNTCPNYNPIPPMRSVYPIAVTASMSPFPSTLRLSYCYCGARVSFYRIESPLTIFSPMLPIFNSYIIIAIPNTPLCNM
ncbi:hypothetical protein BB561_001851 [Smittium simulii]|uniref:Uncharacterized protein n=1 Tax=Smittium simulii TaxID=133385 RepID=A0A2T9YST1_9FUNG|nr:hypothetical protein BB561_001851 [Smittium simulii]